MDVKTVCLGMLTDGAASGYDLKKHFESSFAHFFAAGYGSIYPALSSLAEQGLVTCEEIPQEGKPDRKVYAITEEGMDYLRQALQNPSPCHKLRSEFLATVCFAHLMSDEQLEAVLDSRLAQVECYMQMFADLESNGMDDWPAGKRFVAGFGKAMTEATKKYVEENRHLLVTENKARSATG